MSIELRIRPFSVSVEDCPFVAPVIRLTDYISLFAEAGFSVKTYVNYQEREEDGRSRILCFVCKKTTWSTPGHNKLSAVGNSRLFPNLSAVSSRNN